MLPRYTAEKSGLWWSKGRGLGSRHKTDQGEKRSCLFAVTCCWPQAPSPGCWRSRRLTAQETVKIGLILPMTGGQASTGKQIDNAVKLYMQQNGDTVAGKKIEVILKDDGAVPDNTKRLAQELIVNDKVNFIAGFGVTPAALAAAPLATQAKIPEIVMAAGTSIITERSPYIVRTSLHAGAVVHHHRRLGRQERHQEGRDADLRLRARQRRAELLQAELHRRRRRDRRRGQGAAAKP